jgi:acetyl esterase/lipase
MVRNIGLAAVAAIVALGVINKDKILARLRGHAESKITAVTGKPADRSPSPTPDKPGDSAAAAAGDDAPAAPKVMTLPGLRKALKTSISGGERDETPAPEPPAGDLEKVTYDAPLGKNVAYVTPVKPGARRPAIIWIHGGFNFGIDSSSWEPSPRENDQSAAGYRKAGIAEMYPALRGTSGNPGKPECFLGEVDDILAAADFLAKRPDVDPNHLYLGGHSTGGLMVLLAAASTPRFRTVFSFGPVADPRQYGKSSCEPQDPPDDEAFARSAIQWLHEIVTPTYIIDGANGNAGVFPMMQKRIGRAPITFLTIPGADHFKALGPGNDVIAKAILADTGDRPAIKLTVEAIQAAMKAN